MGSWVAKVDEKPVTQILGNVAIKVTDDRGARLLVGPHNVPHVLRV
jgi:hypothetical protein